MRRIAGLIVSLGAAVLAACATSPPLNPVGADATTFWTIAEFPGAPSHPGVTFVLDRQALVLDAPCYSRGWAYRAEAGGELTFPNAFSSSQKCDPKSPPIEPGTDLRTLMNNEAWDSRVPKPPMIAAFDTAMLKVRGSVLDGDRLLLVDAERQTVLSLKPFIAKGLEHRRWTISEFFDGKLVRSMDAFGADGVNNNLLPWIIFSNGGVSGSSGCGSWVGNYEFSNDRLNFGGHSLLTGSCFEVHAKAAGKVIAAMAGERTVKIEGNRAVLTDSKGRVQAILTSDR